MSRARHNYWNAIIGKNIRRELAGNKVKQVEAAKAMEISQQQLSKLLSGSQSVFLVDAIKLSKYLGISITRFFNEN